MKKSLCIAAVLTLALSACTHMELGRGGARTGLCHQDHDHCLVVTIDKNAGGAWEIKVNNPELHVAGPQHVIFWQIINTGAQAYKFPDDGINFQTDAGKKEFTCRKMDDHVFRCNDPNSIRGKFKYGITVTGAPAVPTLDPWVFND